MRRQRKPSPRCVRAGSTRAGRESVALRAVPRDEIHVIEEFPDEFDLKYRRVDGYLDQGAAEGTRARAGLRRSARTRRRRPRRYRAGLNSGQQSLTCCSSSPTTS